MKSIDVSSANALAKNTLRICDKNRRKVKNRDISSSYSAGVSATDRIVHIRVEEIVMRGNILRTRLEMKPLGKLALAEKQGEVEKSIKNPSQSHRYCLVHKDMHQRCLMKLSRTNIDGDCLSSGVVSIALAYFLNSLNSSLKYAVQFSLIQILQNF
jgi:hypothetical protein